MILSLFDNMARRYPFEGVGDRSKSNQKVRLRLLMGNLQYCTEAVFSRRILPAITAQLDTSHPVVRGFFQHHFYALGVVIFVLGNLCMAGVGAWAVLEKHQAVIQGIFWAVQGCAILLVAESVIKACKLINLMLLSL